MKKLAYAAHLLISSVLVTACTSLPEQRAAIRDSGDQKLTLGTAQKEIKEGMTQSQVAQALGAPNLVTRDRDGTETWIYDKVSTDYTYSASGGAGTLILGYAGNEAGGSSRTQRTLTIILKFNDNKVKEFTYNASSF